MNVKINTKSVLTIIVIGLLLYVIFNSSCAGGGRRNVSFYGEEVGGDVVGSGLEDNGLAAIDMSGSPPVNIGSSCAMNSGIGLASSLLPREMASQEDFGEFAPNDLLAGQNFLDPRNQIGVPETVGGTLRNANLQIRADPPNPKQAFVWNNTTIVADRMQRNLA